MTSGLALAARVVLSLLAVLAVLWLLSRVLRGTAAGRAGAPLEVLGRQALGRGASVAVVRVAGRALVLGVTEEHVSLLGETTAEALGATSATPAEPAARPPDAAAGPPPSWRRTVEAMRERTVRRR